MTGRKSPAGRQPPVWQPLVRVTAVPNPAWADITDPALLAEVNRPDREIWRNGLYQVIVRRHADGWVESLSIRRHDRKHPRDWRHLQKIKNQLAGAEIDAVERFPPESRLVDKANQTWIWCLPPGLYFPFGFGERQVSSPEEAAAVGAKQRPFEEGH